MIVIPAIDIIDKKVVRLTQGDFATEKIYSDDPVNMAIQWQGQGAELIHIVDLDGARTGEPKNLDIVARIAKAINIPIQLGGGLRTRDDIDMALLAGVGRVIIGTKAAIDINFIKGLLEDYGDRIIVSIDVMGVEVMASGWGEEIPKTAFDMASEMSDIGVSAMIFSNIIQDGTMKGIKEYWVLDMIRAAGNAKVIIAGGISSLDDIVKLKAISEKNKNLYGAITGKAIYEGRLDLANAIKIAKDIT
jgi:phosphoribosylformimino-5-aminoimidazole carboxamide ribotide isomerase